MEINYIAIAVATVAAFILSSVWYGLLGSRLAKLSDAYATSGAPGPATIIGELARSLIVAVVTSVLIAMIGIDGFGSAVLLALLLWFGFPLVILSGSVLHEKVPWKLAAIHAGDWLLKLILIASIVGVWR